MKPITKSLLLGSIVLFASLPALAGHGHARIGERLERQHQRIEQGVESGELTRHEVKKLRKQQRRIRHLAADLREDGRMNRKERLILHAKLDKASARIYALKHNAQQRGRRHHERRNRDGDFGYRYSERGDSAAIFYWMDEDNGWPRYGYNPR